MVKDYTGVLQNIINDELEGRCSESECVEWLYNMGLSADDLKELGYDYLNDFADPEETCIDDSTKAWNNEKGGEEAAK